MTGQDEPRAGVLGPVAVVGSVTVCVLAGVLASFRLAGLLLSAVLGVAALARLLLPLRRVGLLAVRSRAVDVLTLGVLAASVAVLSVTAPNP